MRSDLAPAFSGSFAQARVRFLEAAAAAGLALSSHPHPIKGRDGEDLALDVALAGDPNAAAIGDDGSSSSARLTGLMWNVAYEECPQAEYTAIAMEYGTLPIQDMVTALRAEHWLRKHPHAPSEQARSIKQQMLDAFYVDTDAWRGQIIAQARQALFQGADGLVAQG